MIKLPLTYVVRHGQTEWNAEYRLQGQADTDITETGRKQADQNGRKLAGLIDDSHPFDFVASPMRRTRETMERIRVAMGLAPDGYRTDARLMELHFGDWQGFTFAELEAQKQVRRRHGTSTNGASCRQAKARRAMKCCSSASGHGWRR